MISTYRGDIQEAHTVARTGGDIARYLRDFREIGRDIFGAAEPANNGPATRLAAADGNNTSKMLDELLRGNPATLNAAANMPAGQNLQQTAVAQVDREQQLASQRLAEQPLPPKVEEPRSVGPRMA
jgi:hypothetical protein